MKKRILSICLIVCLLAVAIGGATLAYFTDTDSAKNVMTMGKVDIEQKEWERDDQGTIVKFTQDKPLLPMGGDPAWADKLVTVNEDSFKVFASDSVVDKIVTVDNVGNTPAYVRTIVALEAGKSATEAADLWNNNIAVTDNSDGQEILCEDTGLYVEIDGTYYIIVVYTYAEEIAAGANAAPTLTGVALYKDTKQETVANLGATYEILVISQAVQTADMGDNAGAALDAAFGDVDATNVKAWFEETEF